LIPEAKKVKVKKNKKYLQLVFRNLETIIYLLVKEMKLED
jgi:hypothetical protein